MVVVTKSCVGSSLEMAKRARQNVLVHVGTWQEALGQILGHPSSLRGRPIVCISPCCGLDVAAASLRVLGLHVTNYAFDTNSKLEAGAMKMNTTAEGFDTHSCLKFGIPDGDVTKLDVKRIPQDSEILLAGPPCPPWSKCGAGGQATMNV